MTASTDSFNWKHDHTLTEETTATLRIRSEGQVLLNSYSHTFTGQGDDPNRDSDGSGNALAVWYQFDGYRGNIWANRFE